MPSDFGGATYSVSEPSFWYVPGSAISWYCPSDSVDTGTPMSPVPG